MPLGATSPAVATGSAATGLSSTVALSPVKLGTSTLPAANVLYVGASPGTAGLYQVNIQVPQGLNDGDYPIAFNLGTFSTPVGAFLTVKN